MIDMNKYRVNLMCDCAADMAYGYGPTIEDARKNARAAFRRHHGNRSVKVAEEVIEHAVTHKGGGSHYELIPEASDKST